MYILEGRHEARPELDVDWTLCPEDWAKELMFRKVRSDLIKGQLLAGRPVCYRSSGWSLCPRVRSNDQTTYEPVTSADKVQVDDIVFCEVQLGDRFYAHLVKRREWRGGAWYFTISNAQGRESGWCIEHIYGRLVECIR